MNNFSLNQKDKDFLLNLARQAIKNYLETNQILKIDEKILENYSPVLKEKIPCFVTLTINDELRGCIGCFQTNKSLYETVIEWLLMLLFLIIVFFQSKRRIKSI
jgi:AMMECR1 domain-containing protein